MVADERALLEALRSREKAERFLRNLEGMQQPDSVPGDARRELRQEYVDRILAAEHEVSRLKEQLSSYLRSLRGEPAQRLQAILDAETPTELEAVLGVRRGIRVPPVATRDAVSTAPGWTRRIRALAIGLACVAVVVFVLLRWGPPLPGGMTGGADRAPVTVSLETGDRVAVGAGQIGPEGGSLVVTGTGGPLDGLALDVPAGSYKETVTFDLSYNLVESFDAPEGVAVLSPLIHLDAGTTDYADGLIAVTIPVNVPEGQFASLFVYDEETRTLKGLPTLEESKGTLTMLGTHLCPIIALSAPYERLVPSAEKLPVSLDRLSVTTRFKPGQDGWNLVNAGSVIVPAGYCHGMSLTSLYYFMVERGIQGTPLFQKEYENGLPQGMGTPGFWQDDRWAIQLCSVANSIGTVAEKGSVVDAMAARIARLAPGLSAAVPARQFYLTALALYVTQAPQLLGLYTDEGEGHSALCYGVKDHTLLIADPNFPGKTDAAIEFNNDRLGPYRSPLNVNPERENHYISYGRVYYQGDISFFNLNKLQSCWTDYKAGTLDTHFPNYTIIVTELDDRGAELDRYTLNTVEGMASDTRRFLFELQYPAPGSIARLTVFRYGNPPSIVSQDDSVDLHPVGASILGITLEQASEVLVAEGESYLGFLVEELTPDGWTWCDLNWVHVSAVGNQPEPAAAPTSFPLDFNECQLIVEFESGTRNTATGEISAPCWKTLGGSYRGAFYGNTFKATWSEEYEPGSRYHTVNHGSLTVTVDPLKPEVVSFFWEDQWDYTCGGLRRYAVGGSGIQLESWDSRNMIAFFAGGFSGQKPVQPQVTWTERLPSAGSDCYPPFAACELLSIENYTVEIGFYLRNSS